LHTKTKLKKKA